MAYAPLTKIPQQFFDNLGNPLVSGTLYAYLAGTSTPTNMFSDNAGTVAGTSVVLDSRGEPTTFKLIWLNTAVIYKFVLKDSTGTTIWTIDNISGDDGTGNTASSVFDQQTLTATAGQTLFTLGYEYVTGTNAMAVYKNGSRLITGTDFTETSSTSVTLTMAAIAGDEYTFIGGQDVSSSFSSSNVSFIQSGTGAVTRSVQTKLRETVSVKDFGAVGDGTTDDLAAFQAAIAAAVSSKITRVYAPGGTYYLSGKLTLTRGITLYGDGCAHLPVWASGSNLRGTVLKINGAASSDCLEFDTSTNAGRSGLRDISIYHSGSLTNRSVVAIANHLYPVLENVEIASLVISTGSGLFITGGTLWGAFHNVVCTIDGVGFAYQRSFRYGVQIYGLTSVLVSNANSFVSGQFAGTWAGMYMDGNAGDTGALSCVFHGCKFDSIWDGTATPTYRAAANNVYGYTTGNLYVWRVVHVQKGRDTAFHGCYFESASAPANYNDGVNGSNPLIAVVQTGGDATYTSGSSVLNCNFNACYLYDLGLYTLCSPTVGGLRHDTRQAAHLGVRRNSAQSIPAYAWTKIQFNTVLFGNNSELEWDATNYQAKIRSSGTYLINAQVAYDGWTHVAGIWASIRTTAGGYQFNGSRMIGNNAGEQVILQVTATVNLVNGETVTIESIQVQGSSQNTSANDVYMSIVKIG